MSGLQFEGGHNFYHHPSIAFNNGPFCYWCYYPHRLRDSVSPVCGGVCFRNNGPYSGVLNQTNKRKLSSLDRLALPQDPTAMRLGDSPKQTMSESTW